MPAVFGIPARILDTTHGLGSNQIHGLARDVSARLWLASPVGLASFDGCFTRLRDRRDGLRCNGLRCVAIDADGSLWIGTDLGLEVLDASGRPAFESRLSDWHLGLCQDIDVTGSRPWVGTAKGLARLERDPDQPGFRVAFSADVGFVNDVCVIDDAQVLAATATFGVVESNGHSWWRYKCEGLLGRLVSRIERGRDGVLLFGSSDGLLLVDSCSKEVLARVALDGVESKVTAITVAPNCYWVAFGRELLAFGLEAGEVRFLERARAESLVNDLLADELGNVFVATNTSGLEMLSCLRHAIQPIDVQQIGGVYSIRPTGGSGYCIGGDNLFGRIQLLGIHKVAPLSSFGDLPECTVWDSLDDAGGTWLATSIGLFHAPPDGPFRRMFADDPVLGAPNRVLLERDGDLWVGTLRGLARIRNRVVEAQEPNGASLGYVYALHLDEAGVLWVATLGRGLWREYAGWHQFDVGPLQATGNTYAVAGYRDCGTVVVQDEQVVLIDAALMARKVAELPPVAGWNVLWRDSHTVAIGASDGLKLLDLRSGKVIRNVRALLPLRDWEFTNNRTLVADECGRLLCGLSSGLVRIDVDKLAVYRPPECRLGDVIWSGAVPEYVGAQHRLRPGRWSVRVRAYSAWFVESPEIRYQFKLVGFDEHWSDPVDRPEASFTSLPTGEYRLLCRAHSPLAGQGPEAELLCLRVSRPLWAMGWAALLASLESGYDRLVRSRARNLALLAENRRLEEGVAERTESLRASNRELESLRDALQQLSEIDELTRIGNRRYFEREIDRSLALVDRTKAPLALLLIDVDNFKSINDLYGHQAGDDYLRAIAEVIAGTTRRGEGVVARIGGEEFAIALISATLEGAIQDAGRVRAGVEALNLPNEGSVGGVATVSIGVAIRPVGVGMSKTALIESADQALYQAKRSGRNRVVVAST